MHVVGKYTDSNVLAYREGVRGGLCTADSSASV